MKAELKEGFLHLWKKYFGDSELPVTFYYSDEVRDAETALKPKGRSCIICELKKVRDGRSVAYNEEAVACSGGKRYLGFTNTMRPGFEYFLSCGNETMEGERYIRTPEMVKEIMNNLTPMPVNGRYIIFKRWDKLQESDNPEVVIFFAKPDVLSGLYTLANFDQTDPVSTIVPFGSGCGSIIRHPYMESRSERPRAVIGMFDPSARPCVPADILTFSVPMKRFEKMVGYMEESFLITETWTRLKKRIDSK